MRNLIVMAAILSAAATPAFAAARLACSLDDAAMKLSIESGVASAGERLFDFRGAFVLKDAAVPEVLRSNHLDRTNLMQSWLDRKDLRLRIRAEGGRGNGRAFAELVIRAAAAGDPGAGYDGTYSLTVTPPAPDGAATQPLTVGGKVHCTLGT
ncbi:hypothetical protein [Pararhizobium sp.]|uniref:hypothetical protein n=1 Tax=Pararhizobium sp. TaxID=1977563 RepID=UPI0027207ECE|nr:hypothetical protein [Pararhizobium sp.]MDO9415610.1 hypothetical protein [Pararhizobium sp.]